jgi:O-antigen ligase
VIGQEQQISERDRSSNEYREAEKTNVWWNIQAAPITGIGLGKPYAKPLYLIDLSNLWPFWDYIPHNTVLHLWMKAGIVSFMSFFYVVGTAVVLSMNILRQTRDHAVAAVATVLGAYVVMVVIFSYVDLGLTSPRVMIPFGIALGLIGTLTRLVQSEARTLQAGGHS